MPAIDSKSRVSMKRKMQKREREVRAPHRREEEEEDLPGGDGSWAIGRRQSRRRASLVQNLMDPNDWRVHLQADSRERIVNKIVETLKRHLPFSGEEGLLEMKKIAERFEDKIYVSAVNQSDYLRKISLKMLGIESKAEKQCSNLNPGSGETVNPRPRL